MRECDEGRGHYRKRVIPAHSRRTLDVFPVEGTCQKYGKGPS